ncbi:MAG: 2-keto-4-pentenoate hydratase [Caldimonas sp.]
MNAGDFEAARAALVSARRDARRLAECPPAWRPGDLAEAYRLQGAVIGDLGGGAGWKVAAITAEQQRAMSVAQPVAAPLPAAAMHDASEGPALLRLADFIAPKIECEFAFQLGVDLPRRGRAAYAREEVADAVASLRIGVEIVDPRWPPGSGTLAELADGFNNGAFVAGAQRADWRSIAFASVGIVLTFAGPGEQAGELARGSGAAILGGDPFGALVMLANAQPEGSAGLRAGDIVTTGSCSGAPLVPGRGLYRAEFAGLGSVELRFD